jgi:hypothetical protein
VSRLAIPIGPAAAGYVGDVAILDHASEVKCFE